MKTAIAPWRGAGRRPFTGGLPSGHRAEMLGRLTLLALLALAAILRPGVGQAHAAIVSSEPAPGQRLASAPGVVTLRFTEPINGRLSRATIIDPTGRQFEGGVSGSQEIRVRLSTDAPGIYRVAWTTVSTLDGHTLSGGFRFGVRVDPGAAEEAAVAVEPQRSDLAIAIPRTIEYAALLTVWGMLLLDRLARRQPSLAWVRPPLSIPLAVALASGVVVVVGEGLAAASRPSPSAIFDYLTNGLPGAARLARLSAESLALSLSMFGTQIVAVPALAALVALAGAGHAAAVRPGWWGIAADTMHLAAAGLWAGGILALATLRPPGGWQGPGARSLLARFSPVALLAFLLTIGFGAVRGLQELSEPGDLLTSSYGQVLSAKVLAVVAMVPLSLLAWRRLVAPRLEATLGVLVIAAAALLAAYPLPPGRVVEAEAAREQARPSLALPRDGDLALGGDAGEVVVGLTLRPGNPGPNQALIFLLPLEGEAAAAGIPVDIAVNGRPIESSQCGPACRNAQVDLRGGDKVEVSVGSSKGGMAIFDLPTLPAPDGAGLLERMQERMRKLRTLRIEEVLGPADPPVRAEYMFQAPDRMDQRLSTGSALVWIGGTRYLRTGPEAAWQVEDSGVKLDVPLFVWDPPAVQGFIAPRLVGTSELEGIDTQIVSFFAQAGVTPIWFRLWVDAEGLVHRAEMRAQGHVMDHRYADFDAGFTIEPPSR